MSKRVENNILLVVRYQKHNLHYSYMEPHKSFRFSAPPEHTTKFYRRSTLINSFSKHVLLKKILPQKNSISKCTEKCYRSKKTYGRFRNILLEIYPRSGLLDPIRNLITGVKIHTSATRYQNPKITRKNYENHSERYCPERELHALE